MIWSNFNTGYAAPVLLPLRRWIRTYLFRSKSLRNIGLAMMLYALTSLPPFGGTEGSSQDIHFSQFYASPLVLNPAMTGDYVGDYRIINNYRRQWGSLGRAFHTLSVGYDQQMYVFSERFSIGGAIVHDRSGDGMLQVNRVLLSLAYHKKVNGHQLHFGIQPSINRRSFVIDSLSFPDQWDQETGVFDMNRSQNESLGDDMNNFGFNLGMGWSKRYGDFEPAAGLAVYHLNRPRDSFDEMNEESKLPMRMVLSVGGRYKLNDMMFLMPNMLFMWHSAANNFLLGSNVGHKIPERYRENLIVEKLKMKSVFAGGLFRSGYRRNVDSFILIGGVNLDKFDVGISYDFTVSGLRKRVGELRALGAFEISVIYTSLSTMLTKTTIPCDRL